MGSGLSRNSLRRAFPVASGDDRTRALPQLPAPSLQLNANAPTSPEGIFCRPQQDTADPGRARRLGSTNSSSISAMSPPLPRLNTWTARRYPHSSSS